MANSIGGIGTINTLDTAQLENTQPSFPGVKPNTEFLNNSVSQFPAGVQGGLGGLSPNLDLGSILGGIQGNGGGGFEGILGSIFQQAQNPGGIGGGADVTNPFDPPGNPFSGKSGLGGILGGLFGGGGSPFDAIGSMLGIGGSGGGGFLGGIGNIIGGLFGGGGGAGGIIGNIFQMVGGLFGGGQGNGAHANEALTNVMDFISKLKKQPEGEGDAEVPQLQTPEGPGMDPAELVMLPQSDEVKS